MLVTSKPHMQHYQDSARSDYLSRRQDNVIQWEIGSWRWWSHVQMGQHYKVTMNAHFHKSEPILIVYVCYKGVKAKQNGFLQWFLLSAILRIQFIIIYIRGQDIAQVVE